MPEITITITKETEVTHECSAVKKSIATLEAQLLNMEWEIYKLNEKIRVLISAGSRE